MDGDHKLDIDFISQYEVRDEKWQTKSCAIACLAMAMKYFGVEVSIDELLEEAKLIGGSNGQGDWTHEHLVMLVRNHGLNAYRQEFKSFDVKRDEYIRQEEFFAEGVRHLCDAVLLYKKLVLISAKQGLGSEGNNHMVLVAGVKMEENEVAGFYLLDPERKQDGEEFLTLKEFEQTWRRQAIFAYPLFR